MLIDKFGRQITYVRLSITDKCNLRCFYCMPNNGMEFLPKKELLSYEELLRLSSILTNAGVTKIRLTGGEPFVRKDLIGFIEKLNQLKSQPDIHITTNGVLLKPHLETLKELRIKSVNLSLDTLDPQRFQSITNRDYFKEVWSAFEKLMELNISTKVNMVVMKDRNELDIIPMAQLAAQYPVQIRFIEEMPFNGSDQIHDIVSYKNIEEILNQEFLDLKRINTEFGSTSINYKASSLKGSLGIIPAFSRTFCGTCNRIRITSQGILKNCLYDDKGLNLKKLMRSGITDVALLMEIQNWILKKEIDGFTAEKNRNDKEFESMSIIGG